MSLQDSAGLARIYTTFRGGYEKLSQSVRSFRQSAVRKPRAVDDSASNFASVKLDAEREAPTSPENPAVAAFLRDGFIGPIDLFTREQCELILKHYRRAAPPLQPGWMKDLAVCDRFFYEVATRSALISLLKPLLGQDIVLWGATV